MISKTNLNQNRVREDALRALEEDVETGDVTALLIPEKRQSQARVITREEAILCGEPWFEAVFKILDPTIRLSWQVADGTHLAAGQTLCTLQGSARSLVTGERTALNFLQTLSATATQTYYYAQAIASTACRLLDTRKTLPGLRYAQKYATRTGGAFNHRMGLYDAYLIKENHIMAAGSIKKAISEARRLNPNLPVEIEVENIAQLQEALIEKPYLILLDNFSLKDLTEAVSITKKRVKLEASGNIDLTSILPTAQTGVDFISVGKITKDVKAIDLSMRFAEDQAYS